MHNFVYLAQRRSQEFSCEPNLGGRAPPPGCATVRHCEHLCVCAAAAAEAVRGYVSTRPCVAAHTGVRPGGRLNGPVSSDVPEFAISRVTTLRELIG